MSAPCIIAPVPIAPLTPAFANTGFMASSVVFIIKVLTTPLVSKPPPIVPIRLGTCSKIKELNNAGSLRVCPIAVPASSKKPSAWEIF